MTDLALRVCPACRELWMEDDRMYFDPDRCPHCGGYPEDCAFFFGGGAGGAAADGATWQGSPVTWQGESVTWQGGSVSDPADTWQGDPGTWQGDPVRW